MFRLNFQLEIWNFILTRSSRCRTLKLQMTYGFQLIQSLIFTSKRTTEVGHGPWMEFSGIKVWWRKSFRTELFVFRFQKEDSTSVRWFYARRVEVESIFSNPLYIQSTPLNQDKSPGMEWFSYIEAKFHRLIGTK